MRLKHLSDFYTSPFALSDDKAVRIASELDTATEQERVARLSEETRRKVQELSTAFANRQALKRLCAPRLTSLHLQASQLAVIKELKHSHTHCVASRLANNDVFTLIVRADDEESRDVKSVYYEAESDLGLEFDSNYYQPFSVVRFRLARIVLLAHKPEEYLPAQQLWKRNPQADLPRVRWRPLQPNDTKVDPRLRRLLWPELDAPSEKPVPNLRGWQVEITANVKSLAKLNLNTLDARYGLYPSALFGLPEQVQRIFEDLIESFLIGCGLREKSFDANRETSGLDLFGTPPWLRLARDELLSRRFQEMAVGAGANVLSGSQADKPKRQATPNRSWEITRAA